eukprot:57032-Hanusia_phi.AAC.3
MLPRFFPATAGTPPQVGAGTRGDGGKKSPRRLSRNKLWGPWREGAPGAAAEAWREAGDILRACRRVEREGEGIETTGPSLPGDSGPQRSS